MYMQKKLDLFLKIVIIIWTCIVVYFFLSQFEFNEVTINGKLYFLTQTEEAICAILFSLIFVIFSMIMPPFNIIVIYLIYRKITKNKIRKNSKFSKHNLNYCREHLNKLSPEILSYLKNFTIEFEKDISAHILKLLYEGYLIEENNIIKKSNKETNLLSNSDLLVIKMVENNYYENNIKKEYEHAIEKEAMEQGLITLKSKRWKSIGIKFGIFLLGTTLLFNGIFIFSFEEFSEITMLFFALAFALVIILMFFASLYFIANLCTLLKNKTSIVRTSKGNQIVKNALELKKFLNDFGALDNSDYKEVYTREYFLIYAVVLSINKKIPKQIFDRCQQKKVDII